MQPLLNVKHVQTAQWGPSALGLEPSLTTSIMQTIAVWADTEAFMGRLLSTFMGVESPVGLALYLGLKSPDAQRRALKAAAVRALKHRKDDLDLYDLVMKAIAPVRDRRNDLAHGLWGHSPEIAEALLWKEAGDDLLAMHRILEILRASQVQETQQVEIDAIYKAQWEGVFVYRKGDAERDLKSAWEGWHAVFYLWGYLTSPADKSHADEHMRKSLLAIPLIQKIASRQKG